MWGPLTHVLCESYICIPKHTCESSKFFIYQLMHKRIALTFSRLVTYIYMSYRTANLQMLHFIYLFNKYTY